jgi:hypothetical protein
MARNLVCSECGGKMQRGFVIDTAGAIGQLFEASYWIEGVREKNCWGVLKTKGKKKYYISAYRCERCNFMKFYAGPDHSANKQE